MKDLQHTDPFFEQVQEWRNETVKDMDLITAGLRVQGDEGKDQLLKFYSEISYKILKRKKFVSETNASNLKRLFFFRFFLLKPLQYSKKRLHLQPQLKHGPVVQLVRIQACHAWGREFESRPDRIKKGAFELLFCFLYFSFLFH